MNKIEEVKKELEKNLGYNFNNWGKGDLQMLKEIINANDKVVKNRNEELKEAYRITIDDLEIAIRSCGSFEFKQRKEYYNLIKEYKRKLYCL